jgi:uncharacterized protein (TIGR02996 family)
MTAMRTFVYRDGKSHKFWNVELRGRSLTVTYGRVGTKGRSQTTTFPDEAKAIKEHDRLVAQKLRKGYAETTPAAAPGSLRAALESALAANPDDLASHMAYADLLTEQGDPRGEFVRVQLALEDESVPAAQRKEPRRRERELLDAHEVEWLGKLAPLLLGTPDQQRALFAAELKPEYADRLGYTTREMEFRHTWARGWLDSFECDNLGVGMARKLGRAPAARLLRALVCRGDESAAVFRYAAGPDVPDGRGWFRPCEVLAHYPAVANVRVFQYGREADPEEDRYWSGTQFDRLAPLVGRMPRLEELSVFGHIYGREAGRPDLSALFSSPTLGNLRLLRYYHGHTYPLEALAANPALGRLTHLLCFPHSFAREIDRRTVRTAIGRAGVRAIVTSPHLTALTHLQLRCCDGGDPMVEDIVASGVLRRLKVLDLRHGHVTDRGARLLASCPEARNLEVLDLINNRLTPSGVAALRRARVPVRAERQQDRPYHDDSILYYGDSE